MWFLTASCIILFLVVTGYMLLTFFEMFENVKKILNILEKNLGG